MDKGDTTRRPDIGPLFEARSVALIGASPQFMKPSGLPLKAMLDTGYQGNIYPVNPNYNSIANLTCYPTVEDIPAEVDLAIIAVPAAHVMPILYQCAAKKIKGVIIFSSGFAETGEEGKLLEKKINDLASDSGMRVLGPNCLGAINNLNGLWASFSSVHEREHTYPHRFSLITQSGFIGAFIYTVAGKQQLGFEHFASVGNQADVTFTDCFDYMVHSSKSKIITGYIEGLKQGRRFLKIAREAREKEKPVIVMKVGRSEVGASAAASHTGSIAGADRIYDDAFRQVGVIRATTQEKLLGALTLAAAGRYPKGNRVAIISASGGGGVVLADECEQNGLKVASFTLETRRELDRELPFFASSANPVDLTGQFLSNPELLLRCLTIVEKDPNIDMVIVSFHVSIELAKVITEQMVSIYRHVDKPLMAIGYPNGDTPKVDEIVGQLRSAGIPVINETENGIWAVAALADWAKRYRQASATPVQINIGQEKEKALKLLRTQTQNFLPEYLSAEVLKAYGIGTPDAVLAHSPEEAAGISDRLGYPVVLKVQSPDILHKTDVGGVAVKLYSSNEVKAAFSNINQNVKLKVPDALVEGILVQKMISHGQEVIIGIKKDEVFGPVIMFGLGGIFVEVLEDVSFRVAPLTPGDAREMIREIKGFSLLTGARGSAPADLDALEDTLLKVSRLAVELGDEIEEMEINPLFVLPVGEGVVAADALIIRKG